MKKPKTKLTLSQRNVESRKGAFRRKAAAKREREAATTEGQWEAEYLAAIHTKATTDALTSTVMQLALLIVNGICTHIWP
jgi:hypothetical protein